MQEATRVKPLPGTIILLQIKGVVGKLVWAMQLINRDTSKWTHVAIMLDDGTVFEAQPGGAVITDWAEYTDRPHDTVKYVQMVHPGGKYYQLRELKLTESDRMLIVAKARTHVGIGYNWTTYFYLATYRLGIRPNWLKNRVQKDKRMICSQAADQIYHDSGIFLFSDGRLPYDVTPGDLARLI